ncbi:NADPH:adrenodoxin oxidoreductase, putative [Phytophthora infestans T30-4]|uniref:NADPH:adrenodoxin oxidoreductase, mitochondrial n=1 Tax=Phytophthora infestans (strain T30-4) TaxID=403677 RepID=D0N252_PHYIT|nr:NADPH:adrenodoxin oxidoreductase, putative [Phytophthora infestans T30-4]EEY68381.1 NADPH:adrenodoxin oxidoreductase, putative [Phytophthora infestans T30-4]|eukprot:XP_002905540.1 NADPH:adrenodoxin oxidoreductase, putative [Phytophthora infestans T30-4]
MGQNKHTGNCLQIQIGSMLLRRAVKAGGSLGANLARSVSAAVPDVPRRRVCVVGSGPGGFYATKYLLKEHAGVRVDMLEALPTPFGLVRSGVAPDHPEVKSVMSDFEKVANNERFRFLGNVRVGEDISLAELQRHYHAVVLAYGAAGDRKLGVPGESLRGVMSSRTFVNWYNGHPAFRDLELDLAHAETAVVIGQGNVAVDCARILLKNVDQLASTDITAHAMEVLRNTGIKRVFLVGRRGSAQAAFTMKEIRELTKLEGVACIVDPEDMKRSMTNASEQEIKEQRARKRMNELLIKAADNFESVGDGKRIVQIKFLRSPTEILADEKDPTRVGALRVEKTRLEGEANQQRAVGTGEFEDIPCDLVLRSVGYKSLPIETDAPFDNHRHVVSNDQGRVVTTSSNGEKRPVVGLYCTGWVKRGPSGIIGTNIVDARETVSCIVEDLAAGHFLHSDNNADEDLGGLEAVTQLVKKRNPDKQLVSWAEYERLNAEENRRGELVGKPREKVTSITEMLEIAKSVN